MEISKREVTVWEAVKKQYMYKMRLHINYLGVILLIMLTAGLLIISGNTTYIGDYNLFVKLNEATSDSMMILYFLMIFIVGIRLTIQKRQVEMLSLQSNKWSNHAANGLLLITLSSVISVLVYLMHYVTFLGHYLINGVSGDVIFIERLSLSGFTLTIVVTFLYLLFVALLGYFVGEVVQFNKLFLIVWIVLGFMLLNQNETIESHEVSVVDFYVAETSISMFLLKIIPSILLVFLFATLINRRKVVRD